MSVYWSLNVLPGKQHYGSYGIDVKQYRTSLILNFVNRGNILPLVCRFWWCLNCFSCSYKQQSKSCDRCNLIIKKKKTPRSYHQKWCFTPYSLLVASLTVVHVFQGFRHSPRHARRSVHPRITEEKPILTEIPESEPDPAAGLRKRKVKKRVLPEFYQSVQVTPTRKPVGTHFTVTMSNADAVLCLLTSTLTSCVLATGIGFSNKQNTLL